jgi:hypothetical protein
MQTLGSNRIRGGTFGHGFAFQSRDRQRAGALGYQRSTRLLTRAALIVVTIHLA